MSLVDVRGLVKLGSGCCEIGGPDEYIGMARQCVGELIFVARSSSGGKSLDGRRIGRRLRLPGCLGKLIFVARRSSRGKSLDGRRIGRRLRLPG
jgi:hypothetical protein